MKRLNRRQRIIRKAIQRQAKQRNKRTIPFTIDALTWELDYSVPGTFSRIIFGNVY